MSGAWERVFTALMAQADAGEDLRGCPTQTAALSPISGTKVAR
jgi:hypothetical protein